MTINHIVYIKTGFLTDNLFAEDDPTVNQMASVNKYAAMIEAAIKAEYPGAEVEVEYQIAGGVLPYPLRTQVHFANGDIEDDPTNEHVNWIDDTAAKIWQDWQWIVLVE